MQQEAKEPGAFWAVSAVFADMLVDSWLEVEQLGLKPMCLCDANAAGSGFIHYTIGPAPSIFLQYLH